ncbi:30S ribosomal protein S9 [Candidatus Collierbacteria bacterium]|nr:30S ribosomal protein S9 [Candidatus Collierbacteria bacterium]
MATKLTKNKRPVQKPITKKSPAAPKGKILSKGLGRRRSAVAKVRLISGKQEIVINNKPASIYWSLPDLQSLYLKPFLITDTLKKYSATAVIKGSGTMGQIGAFVHAAARALAEVDPENYRPLLKKHGLLTRDPRMKETRKVGRGGKARHKKQSPKR